MNCFPEAHDTTPSKNPSCLALLQNPVCVHQTLCQCKHALCQLPTLTWTYSHHSPHCVFRTLLITGRREWVGGSRVILPAAPEGDKISFVLLVEGSIPGVCWRAGSSCCYITGGISFNVNNWRRIRLNDMWRATHGSNVSRSRKKNLQLTCCDKPKLTSILYWREGNRECLFYLVTY